MPVAVPEDHGMDPAEQLLLDKGNHCHFRQGDFVVLEGLLVRNHSERCAGDSWFSCHSYTMTVLMYQELPVETIS